MSKILKFKSNLKCEGCVQAITPSVNALKGVISWKVDLTSRPAILEVEADAVTVEEIINAVKQAGYKIELLN